MSILGGTALQLHLIGTLPEVAMPASGWLETLADGVPRTADRPLLPLALTLG